jgi:hypothetical protein
MRRHGFALFLLRRVALVALVAFVLLVLYTEAVGPVFDRRSWVLMDSGEDWDDPDWEWRQLGSYNTLEKCRAARAHQERGVCYADGDRRLRRPADD